MEGVGQQLGVGSITEGIEVKRFSQFIQPFNSTDNLCLIAFNQSYKLQAVICRSQSKFLQRNIWSLICCLTGLDFASLSDLLVDCLTAAKTCSSQADKPGLSGTLTR